MFKTALLTNPLIVTMIHFSPAKTRLTDVHKISIYYIYQIKTTQKFKNSRIYSVSWLWTEMTFEDDKWPPASLLTQANQPMIKYIHLYDCLYIISHFAHLYIFIFYLHTYIIIIAYSVLYIYKESSSMSRLGLFLIWSLNSGLARYFFFSARTFIITSWQKDQVAFIWQNS